VAEPQALGLAEVIKDVEALGEERECEHDGGGQVLTVCLPPTHSASATITPPQHRAPGNEDNATPHQGKGRVASTSTRGEMEFRSEHQLA